MENKLWTKDFIGLCCAHLLLAIAFYLLLSTLPVFAETELHANKEEVGLIIGLYTLASILMRPIAGYLIDVTGRKWIYLLSFTLFTAMFSLYTIAGTILFLLVLRFFHGLAWGTVTNSSTTIAVDMVPIQKRGEGIGFYGLSMTLAMAVGPLIGTIIFPKIAHSTFFLLALFISFIGLILALQLKYPQIDKSKINKKFDLQRILEIKAVPISINIFLTMLTYGAIVTFIIIYAKEIGVQKAGLFFLVYAAAISMSRIFSGKIFDKHGPNTLTVIGFIFLLSGFPVLALFKNNLGYLFSAFLIGIGNGVIMPTFTTMVNNMFQQSRRGSANSSFMTFFDLGIGAGAMLIGYLCDKWKLSLAQAFLLCTGVIFISLVYFLVFTAPYYNKHKLTKI